MKLRTIHLLIASTNARIQELPQLRLGLRRSNIQRLRSGAQSQEFRLDSVAAFEIEERQLKQRLQQLEKERRVAENKFLHARREREIAENAIKLQQAAYEVERSRREQMRIDDETLQRRVRQSSET